MADARSDTPLAGLRVLQFGTDLAPQMVGLALADLGADVIRCGQAEADPLSAALDRGKRIADLTGNADTLRELASGADVVIGIDTVPGDLTDAFPQTAVRLALPAFPAGDPRFSGKATDEGAVLAAAGVLAERGPSNRLRGLGPALMPMPIASAYAAAFGTLAVVAGLFGRQRTGRGDALEVSLFGALLEGFSYNHVKIEGLPSRYVDPRAVFDPEDIPLPEAEIQARIDPTYRAFLSADDEWFYIAIPPHRGLIERLLRLCGLWESLLADGLPTDEPYRSTHEWKDPAEGSVFSYPRLAPHWRSRLRNDIAAVIRSQPASYWEQQFAAHGLCGNRVQSSADWLVSREAGTAGLAIRLNDPLSGPMVCAGPFLWAGAERATPPREIVGDGRPRWREKAWQLPDPGPNEPFLSGMRILDFCNVIAGSTVAGCLTRFGAEVVKIDPVRQAFDASITVILSLQSARGKASMLLDLSTETGQAILARLAAQADLVTFNGTETQLDALGLDIDRLSGLNPAIVLAQVSAFGGPKRPRGGQRKGFDEVLQAATGVMHRLKREKTPPEEYAHYGTIDAATGVWGAVAAVAGLLQAKMTGKGGQVGTSLAAGAAAVQMPFLWASERSGAAPDPVGTMPPRSAIAGRIEGDDYVSPDGKREPLARYPDLRARLALGATDDAHATGFIRHADHPAGTAVELVTQCAVKCGETPLVAVGNPSKYGADTRDVLTRLGMSESEIDDAFSSGAVAESWPYHDRFLPD